MPNTKFPWYPFLRRLWYPRNLKAVNPMDFDQISAYAARQESDFVEIVMKNGKTITGKRLRESNISQSGIVNRWQFDEEERFLVEMDGFEIVHINFIN